MNSGLDNVIQFFEKNKKIIITTHESPDADGIGAEIALKELLDSLGTKSFVVNGDPTPDKLCFLDVNSVINIASDFSLPDDISDYSVVVLDTNNFVNTGAAYTLLSAHVNEIFIIDHHEGGEDYIDTHFVMVEASSASEIVFFIMDHYRHDFTRNAAQALYTGLLFDTGGFKYKKTTPRTHLAVAKLLSTGIKPFEIHERIFDINELSAFLLKSKILSTVEVYLDGKMILMHLTPEMLKETSADFSQGETSINLPLSVAEVQVSVLLKQDVDGPLKVSMRTKGDLDVSGIAISNGGGGHKNAAGFKTQLSRDDAKKYVVKQIEELYNYK